MERDTIAAIVTPPGEGGVGILRVSGPLSAELAQTLFPGLAPPWASHRMRHGTLVDPVTGIPIDEALGVLMCAPHSYTGEDVFEIHCHGSPMVLDLVLASCLRAGCRAARPGEFTLRAFLNGRLDLSQAEAVLDIVRARSNLGLELAMRQLAGKLTERIEPLRQDLVGVLARMEAMVDFAEEDVPAELDEATVVRVREALAEIEELLLDSEGGIILREGATLAIVGSPNVGKSSIMNALLGLDRSIVTPIAGTTRDTIEETLEVRGIPFRTIDTAGITATADPVERIGVERSRSALEAADVLLLVLDRSRPLSELDEPVIRAIEAARNGDDGYRQRLVITANKADLEPAFETEHLVERLHPVAVVESSAVRPGGVDALRDALSQAALGSQRREVVTGNVRHQHALRRSAEALGCALQGLAGGTPLDLVSFDVRASIAALGEITGANVDDEILDRIFRDFCIGK